MNIKTRIGAFTVGLGMVAAITVGVAGPASAHVPSITDTCETGVTINGTYYDPNKVNTWDVNIGGTEHSGTFGANVSVHFDIPQGGATTHVTANIQDADHTKNYSQFIDENVGPCGTVPVDVPIVPATFHPATCDAGSTFDVPAQDARVKYTVDSPPVGNGQPLADGVSVTITAHVTAIAIQNGANPGSYTVTYTGQAKVYNATCVAPQQCVVNAPYHESDDNSATLNPAGLGIFSKGDGKATDGSGYSLTSGNAQGITTFDYTKTGEVGNGIFFRLIFDLSADGGPGYASFSGLGTHVDQTTVAGYGSKAAFSGKSISDVANTWPKNKLVAFIWQTGSSYAAGDGATLVSYSGYCGSGNWVPTQPNATHRTTTVTSDIDCSVDGGGSYTVTVTHYTTPYIWDADSQSYVPGTEVIDEGYPQVTPHEVGADVCPEFVTPESPATACNGVVTLPGVVDGSESETANAHYTVAITASTITVTADPLDGFQFNVPGAGDKYTLNEGSAVWTAPNTVCPVKTPPVTLATTGSVPTGAFELGLALLAVGLTVFGIWWFKRREERLEDKAIDQK